VSTQELLDEELKTDLLSISDFFHDETDCTEEERLEMAKALPESIRTRFEQIDSGQADLAALYDRIQQLVKEINEVAISATFMTIPDH